MVINFKALFLQMQYIYKHQGLKGISVYCIKVFNYLVINRYLRGSYSQKGEDLMINKYLKNKKRGFYIDVGACHPQRVNNTKFFYNRGWHGINIEPNPERIKFFLQKRTKDINLNIGIGSKEGKVLFYEFEFPALSTFSKEEANTLTKVGYKLKKKMKVQMYRLEQIMKKYVKSDIDFMTIDTEGLDMDVLASNNWKKYRPKVLCVETIDFIDLLTKDKGISDRKDNISKYLLGKGYEEYFSNGLNTLYEDIQNIKLT